MREVQAYNLVLEVTRRCNMECMHCLRGDAQDIDMSEEIIEALFNDKRFDVSNTTVTFTGGEPTLAPKPIVKFADSMFEHGKDSIQGFYLKTNGKQVNKEIVWALMDLYSRCHEESACILEQSTDIFHEPIEIQRIYTSLSFFSCVEKVSYDSSYVISEGRALENGIGRRSVTNEFYTESLDEEDLAVFMVYVSANGNVVAGCDLSFDRIDEESVGNVLLEPLSDIIERAVKAQG